jgi:hypothetical protein
VMVSPIFEWCIVCVNLANSFASAALHERKICVFGNFVVALLLF